MKLWLWLLPTLRSPYTGAIWQFSGLRRLSGAGFGITALRNGRSSRTRWRSRRLPARGSRRRKQGLPEWDSARVDIIWIHLFASQRRWRVLISAVRAASKFRWWAHANLNLPVKPAMDDYRAVKALGFENIKEVDDKLHWADILATKVAKPKFLKSPFNSRYQGSRFLDPVGSLVSTLLVVGW